MTTTTSMSNGAGESAKRRFRQLRADNLRRDWRIWSGFLALTAVAILFMVFLGRTGLALGGCMLGFATAIATFGWMIAFDVRALPWLWGSWGEEQTGKELAKLPNGWYVRHDVANPYGNWDHIVVGLAGVFVIDSKRLSGRITATNDGLASGRTRFAGKTFRGASVGLREALLRHVPSCPWVQAVVAVWGEFPTEPRELERVSYVRGEDLIEWLTRQPFTLSTERCGLLAQAVQHL